MSRQEIQLQKLEQLALGSKLKRLLHNPFRYLYAMSLIHFVYPTTHKGSLRKADLFFGGDMEVLLPAATDIYLTGGKTHDSEIRLAKYMIANLKSGQHFLDIGAHFGYFTLLAASIVGSDGRVVAVEPAKGSFDVLRRNTAGVKALDIIHNAVSNEVGKVSFYEFPVLYSEYNALDIEKFKTESWMAKNPPVKTEVAATTIDKIINEQNIQPEMIKIDVEGAEAQALSGGLNTWANGAATVIMEYLDEGDASSYVDAANILFKQGYKSHIIDKNGRLIEVSDILSAMRSNNMSSENIVFKKDNK